MTEGRFETVYNLRGPFDQRNFWTKTRERPYHADQHHTRDHMERESCPFHDLRAEGAFQPEYWGPGVGGTVIAAERLVTRAGGKPIITSTGHHNDQLGCGGMLIPCDTDPGRPQLPIVRRVDNRPWCATRKKTDPFSVPPYVTVPPPPKVIPPVEPFFHTGKTVPYLNKAYPFRPDEYGVRVPPAKPDFRLKTGKAPFKLDPRLKVEPGEATKIRAKSAGTKKRQPIPRTQFHAMSTLTGTFSAFPHHIPEPYDEGSVKTTRRPLFTYHTHTKRSMPVAAPWGTGLHTAEPVLQGSAAAAAKASALLLRRATSAPAARRQLDASRDSLGSTAAGAECS